MGSLKKNQFQVGGVTLSANDKTVAQAVLAYALKESGAFEFNHDVVNHTPPALGQPWKDQGGIYAGVIRGDDGLAYHLIVSEAEYELKGEWGNRGTEIEGADSKNDGAANTEAMYKAGIQLAKDVLSIEVGRHEDFYLPSQCELNLCFANAREHFQKEWYWSSTQFSANYGWIQHFLNGSQSSNVKLAQLRARAVRRFPQ